MSHRSERRAAHGEGGYHLEEKFTDDLFADMIKIGAFHECWRPLLQREFMFLDTPGMYRAYLPRDEESVAPAPAVPEGIIVGTVPEDAIEEASYPTPLVSDARLLTDRLRRCCQRPKWRTQCSTSPPASLTPPRSSSNPRQIPSP